MQVFTDSKPVSATGWDAVQASADSFISVINANISDEGARIMGVKFVNMALMQISRRM